MSIEKIKELIDAAAKKYRGLNPLTKKIINVGGGAGVGLGLGSISLGKDSSGKKRGYLLGSNKGDSATIGAMLGAIAANHIPIFDKNAEARTSEIWKKVVEFIDKAKASAKGAYGDIKAKYNSLTPSEKAIINTAGGTLAGGAVGGLVGGKKGLIAGSAVGGATGAAASVDWKAIADAIKSYKKAPKKTESAATETK